MSENIAHLEVIASRAECCNPVLHQQIGAIRGKSDIPVRVVLSESAFEPKVRVIYNEKRKIDEQEVHTLEPLSLQQKKPAIIDYNSIARNSCQIAPLILKVSAATATLLNGTVALSMILLCILGMEQGYLLAKSSVQRAAQGIENKSISETASHALLAVIGLGYICLSACAGVIGSCILASFQAASFAAAIGSAMAVLVVAGLIMYGGAALFGIGSAILNLHFRSKLRSIRENKGNEAALQFLREQRAVLASRTNGFVAEQILSENSRLMSSQLVDLALEANAREIAGNLLLILVGVLGVLSFLISPLIGHIIFLLVSILWLGAMDHPEYVHKARSMICHVFE